MTHDIEDLLNYIKDLEERIIHLEKKINQGSLVLDDSYYWNHG
jgi:cell division septum initiation protein DivIVA